MVPFGILLITVQSVTACRLTGFTLMLSFTTLTGRHIHISFIFQFQWKWVQWNHAYFKIEPLLHVRKTQSYQK